MGSRLALIGFVIAVAIAAFAFFQQQQALNQANVNATVAAEAEDRRVTAVAMMQEAVGTQVQAEAGQATAIAQIDTAATAQAEAQNAQATAVAQAQAAETQSANVMATSTVRVGSLRETATESANAASTVIAESSAAIATIQTTIDAQATTQADTVNQLGTATAQVALAEFARESAEDDRTTALDDVWGLATALASTERELATAQAIAAGITATPRPRPTQATPTPTPRAPRPTAVPQTGDGSTQSFTSSNETVSLSYPSDWVVTELNDGSIAIATSQGVLDREESALQPGDAQIVLFGFTLEQIGAPDGTGPTDVAAGFARSLAQGQNPAQLGAPETVTIGSYDAARVVGTNADNDVSLVVMQTNGDEMVAALIFTAAGELADQEAQLDAILASVTFNP